MLARRIAAAFVAAYGGAWAARIVIELTGPGRWVMIGLFVVGTLAGAAIGWLGSRELEPWSPKEARDAVTGWGFVIGVVLILPTLFLPGPWRVLGALVVAIIVIAGTVVLRRAAGSASAAERQAVARQA